MSKSTRDEFTGLNPMHTTMQMFSPSKLLVESATMIFIMSFGLLILTIMVWKGATLSPELTAALMIGRFVTFLVAVRQYASFR